jgi:hypothetical protein
VFLWDHEGVQELQTHNEFFIEFGRMGLRLRKMRAAESRTEARRLRGAFRQLTNSLRQDVGAPSENRIRNNIEHCRALLVKGIVDETQRQLIEDLLRYMERTAAGSATDSGQLDGGLWPTRADERRLYIIARELILSRVGRRDCRLVPLATLSRRSDSRSRRASL